jgi:hypothetical protein
MKKMKKEFIFIPLIFLLTIFLLFSCPSNPAAGGGGTPEKTIQPPSLVTADYANNGESIQVTWDAVPGITTYEVYKQENGNTFVPIVDMDTGNTISVTGTTFYDGSDKLVRYSVKSISGSILSALSPPSNWVSKYVQNTNASRFKFISENKIELIWDKHPNASSYMVYRSTTEDFTTSTVFNNISGTSYTDMNVPGDLNTPQLDTPYYYKVTWIRTSDNTEMGTGNAVKVSVGIYGISIDFGEPNDDWALLPDDKKTTEFGGARPLIYTLENGYKDVDWYKYYGPVESFNIIINFKSDCLFNPDYVGHTGSLRFLWFTKFDNQFGIIRTSDEIDYNNKMYNFSFLDFIGHENEIKDIDGNTTVYFKIVPDISSANIIGDYSVTIE